MRFSAGISSTNPRSRFRYRLRTVTAGYLLGMRRIRMFGKKGGSKRIRARQRPGEIMVGPAAEGSGRLTHDIHWFICLSSCSRARGLLGGLRQRFHRVWKGEGQRIRKALSRRPCMRPDPFSARRDVSASGSFFSFRVEHNAISDHKFHNRSWVTDRSRFKVWKNHDEIMNVWYYL